MHQRKQKGEASWVEENEFEIKRKVFHTFFGLGIIWVVYFFGNIGILFLLLFLMMSIFLSLTYFFLNLSFVRFFIERFGRREEIRRFPGKGGIIFLSTSLIILEIFPRDIAFASIIILALGDTVSNLFGRFFGRTGSPINEQKKLEGTLAGIIAATLGAVMFIQVHEAIIASVLAMCIESVDWKARWAGYLDDNLTMQITAAATIWMLRLIV